MHGDNEYDTLAEWSEASRMSDYTPRMEWAPIWAGAGMSALLGLGMWTVVRLVAWMVARGWL